MKALADSLRRWAREYPDRTALKDEESVRVDYRDLLQLSQRLSSFLTESGASPEGVTALAIPHGIHQVMIVLGMLAGGMRGVGIDVRESGPHFSDALRAFNCDGLLFPEKHEFRYAEVLASRIADRGIWSVGGTSFVYYRLRQTGGAGFRESTSWILKTSGSTGRAKGVMLAGDELLARSQSEIEYLGMGETAISLNCLTLNHDVGLSQAISNILLGSTMVVRSFLSAAPLPELIRTAGCDTVYGTPFLWQSLLAILAPGELLPPTLRRATISAGSLAGPALLALRERAVSTRFLRTYGQTETFRTFFTSNDELASGCFDEVVPGVKAFVLDEEGREAAPGEVGELVHEGAGVMEGIVDTTIAYLPGRRQVRTGDFFRNLGGGKYEFISRRDGMLKRLDQRFYAVEVEKLVREQEGVEDSFLVLEPSGDLILYLQSTSEASEIQSRIQNLCRKNLPPFKTPSRIIATRAFARTEVGKIDRPGTIASMRMGDRA